MDWLYLLISFLLLVLIQSNQALENDGQTSEPYIEHIRSPMLEVFMHLPPNFRDVGSFKNALGVQRLKRNANPNQRTIVDVRNYEIAQPVFLEERRNASKLKRNKREAEGLQDTKTALEKPESEKMMSSDLSQKQESHSMLPVPDAIRGPMFPTFPVKEFDVVDIDDPDDARRRRTDSSNGPDDSQRDKRTFLEEASGETTTSLPFWKRKKENPPFVTGRAGSSQSGSNYTPAQHRSADNNRESHSLKNLDKSVQSNEISRSNQDSYYSSTNRRTYSRQYDGPTTSTPKSVYDTIDYNNKRNQDSGRTDFNRNPESGRNEFGRNPEPGRTDFGRNPEPGRNDFGRNQEPGRNHEEKKDVPRQIRPTHEQYINRPYQYNVPWMYDRPYYQPPYPYPAEVLGRGVEYYHRSYDPTTGRIIYYANMPDQGRSYDYRVMDPINRSFYVNNRPYPYDPYFRNYIPPFDYRFNGFRSGEYLRNGRSSSQAYSYPNSERDKFQRDGRFVGNFETANRGKDDYRNKTYVIYDAEENRNKFPRPQYMPDTTRLGYTPPPTDRPQVPFKRFPFPPSIDQFPAAAFPVRNNFYPPPQGPAWGFSHRSLPAVADSNRNSRPLNSHEVQLPLTTSNRAPLDKTKKS